MPARRAFLPDAGQEIDRVAPFVESEIGFADEIVQRFHQLFQQEFDARVGRLLEAADNGDGQLNWGWLRSCGLRDCGRKPTEAGRG
jgi:hypothetical protein